jgi:hypothetical protein
MSTISFKLINDKGDEINHKVDAKDFIELYKTLDNIYEDIEPDCTCSINESNIHCECEPLYEDYFVVAFKLNNDEWIYIDPHCH